MRKLLTIFLAAVSLVSSAADYAFDFTHATPLPCTAPTLRKAETLLPEAFPTFAVGDNLVFALFPNTAIQATVAGVLPSSFRAGNSFALKLGDGIFSSTLVENETGVFIELRDIASNRLYRISVCGKTAQIEETDLSLVKRGDCIEIEAPVENAAGQTAAVKKGRALTAVPGNPFDNAEVAPAPVTVDIMMVFDNSARSWVERQTKYSHSITNFAIAQVAKMNSVLANTGLDKYFWYRLVDVMTVDTTYTVVDEQILGIVKAGAESGDGPYGPIKARRAACGADLVTLMIDTGTYWGTTGIGYITHGTNYNTWLGNRAWCYSCCAIQSVDLEYTLSHEVGHNMGLAHSPTLASWERPGTFDYSNGYNFWGKDDGKPYHTIMAYDKDINYSGYKEIPFFSSPNHTYQGTVIGTALSNDCTRALRETCSAFAAWHDTAIPLPSDISFSPSGESAYRITLSNLGGYEIRYTVDGSDPTRNSTLYTEPITLASGTLTIKAVAVVNEDTLGAVAEKTYAAAVELGEYATLEHPSSSWQWGEWCDQSGNILFPTYWNDSSGKTAILGKGGTITADIDVALATLIADGTSPLEIIATNKTLSANTLEAFGSTTLAGTGFSFDKWRLNEGAALTFSPGLGKTATIGKYLDRGASGSTLAISNGTLKVTKGANSGDGISTLQNCALRVDSGGVLSLEPGWVLGYANTNPLTVNKGGVVKINKLESTARPLILNGGDVEINLTGRAYEMRSLPVTVNDDSTIRDTTSNGGAHIYLFDGDSTIDVADGKTLTIDTRITVGADGHTQGRGIKKSGLGEVAFLREISHTGTNIVNAGTFTIGYNSSTPHCRYWRVYSNATLKIADGAALAVPELKLDSGANLELPLVASNSTPPLTVTNSVSLAGVKFKFSGADGAVYGASYPLIASEGGFSGVAEIDKSALPSLGDGLGWKFVASDGVLFATFATAAKVRPVISAGNSLVAEIPDDASTSETTTTISSSPIVVTNITDTAVAFTVDVDIPDTASSTERTICSWTVKDSNVVRCVRRADGVLDVFYNGNNHANNITNSVALTVGRHIIKVGYNYGEYGGTWVFVDDAPAYYAKDLRWHGKSVAKFSVGATADDTPQYPYAGLVVHGIGVLEANSSLPLPNMTGTIGIAYNYLIQNKSPVNSIPSIFPMPATGGWTMDNSLLDAALPYSANSISVSIIASFPADKPGCLFGVWAKNMSDGYAYPGQIDYDGDGTFSFSRNGYVSDYYYTLVNTPSTNVETPHLYTLTYTDGFGFTFYQDGVEILTGAYGYKNVEYLIYNKVTFGRGPWNILTTSYNDNPNPMSNFKVYASHIELGSDDRTISEAAVLASYPAYSAPPADGILLSGDVYLTRDMVADWLDAAGFAAGGDWKSFMQETSAGNGYTHLQNYLLGYTAEDTTKFAAVISFNENGDIVITTNEGEFPSGLGLVKRLYMKPKLDDQWPETGIIIEEKSATFPKSDNAKFYKVTVEL